MAIDCTRFGSGAYSIPASVEHLQFASEASFVLAIETAGMFQRLVKHSYWRTANCILISVGGAYAGDPAIYQAVERGSGHPRLCLRRLRSLWNLQYLSYAQGRVGERGPYQ